MAVQGNEFGTLDYVLFGITLTISLSIGVFNAFKNRNKQSTKEYLLAGGNMGVVPVALSLFASFMSSIAIIGVPAEIYVYNTMLMWAIVSFPIAIFLSAHIHIPIFYNLKLTSAYEVLGSQMPIERADSNTDVDACYAKFCYLPNIKAAYTKDEKDTNARVSSSETERLIREEMDKMESDTKKAKEEKIKEKVEKIKAKEEKLKEKQKNVEKNIDTPKPSTKLISRPKVTTILVKPVEPTKELQTDKTLILKENPKENPNVTEPVDINSFNHSRMVPHNKVNRKLVFCGNMIQSTLDPPRARTPVLARPMRRVNLPDFQKQQMLAGFLEDEIPDSPAHHRNVFNVASSSSNSLAESPSGHGSLPSCSVLLPTTSSSGVISSMSNLAAAAQKERIRNAYETIDIGRQDDPRMNTVDPVLSRQYYRNQQANAPRQVRIAFEEPKKSHIFQRARKQVIRFGHFLRRGITTLSCTSKDF